MALLDSQCWHTMVLNFPFHSCPPPRLVVLWLMVSSTVYPSTSAWRETGRKGGLHKESRDLSLHIHFRRVKPLTPGGTAVRLYVKYMSPLGTGHLKIRTKLRPGKSSLWSYPKVANRGVLKGLNIIGTVSPKVLLSQGKQLHDWSQGQLGWSWSSEIFKKQSSRWENNCILCRVHITNPSSCTD